LIPECPPGPCPAFVAAEESPSHDFRKVDYTVVFSAAKDLGSAGLPVVSVGSIRDALARLRTETRKAAVKSG
jgi:hypothetical protein